MYKRQVYDFEEDELKLIGPMKNKKALYTCNYKDSEYVLGYILAHNEPEYKNLITEVYGENLQGLNDEDLDKMLTYYIEEYNKPEDSTIDTLLADEKVSVDYIFKVCFTRLYNAVLEEYASDYWQNIERDELIDAISNTIDDLITVLSR